MMRKQQSGYVLILVLGLLAVGSFVALRFAERNDALRRQVLGFDEMAQAQADAATAWSVTRYWMATQGLQPMGHGDGIRVLREDGRWYLTAEGAQVAVQDHRGLLSVNALDRNALIQLLVNDGLPLGTAQAWLDVLQDYEDPDSLRRINGAEADDYRAQGRSGPRNDWLLSLAELEQMPGWRDDLVRTRRIARWLHTAINNQFNPNTAPLPVLRARYAGATPEQLTALEGLRAADLLRENRAAGRATGLLMDDEQTLLVPGFTSRVTVWAPGLPQALDYNLQLTPAGQDGPWLVREHQLAPRPLPLDEPTRRALPRFPLDADPGSNPSAPAASR
ncbi:general secretion pathway protein GspK [Inhella crocodyli]|jgi:hypothetical protein|nr:type II secretion system protein GspK [Inhella crocodyli]